MSDEQLVAAITFLVGFVFGWGSRSFQFAADRDCANPDHDKEDVDVDGKL